MTIRNLATMSCRPLPAKAILALILVLPLALPLGACGKKNQPDTPPGSTYPQTYPQS